MLGGSSLDLISKKDMLALTGISYGQLYRWKRQHLIPEEWFIKQSVYTGQETFFPREQILNRIASIQDLMEQYSLCELADILSSETSAVPFSISDLQKCSDIDAALVGTLPPEKTLSFHELAFISALSRIALTTNIRIALLQKALTSDKLNHSKTCVIFMINEQYHIAFTSNISDISFDCDIQMIDVIFLDDESEKFKIAHKNKFSNIFNFGG
ncbi:MAG: DUF4004 family protein [Christensenella sp.]